VDCNLEKGEAMQLNQAIRSPNFDAEPIPVEFLVLHYTAGSLSRALSLLTDPAREVSAHLVVAESGEVFELVPCWDGAACRAWHAGRSSWLEGDRRWERFNDFSLGVELVNLNGNLLPYTQAQYAALAEVVAHLQARYPALRSPTRVLGHEHISGVVGKAAPGRMFDWISFFAACYPDQAMPAREPICPRDLQAALKKIADAVPETAIPAGSEAAIRFWHGISATTETSVRLAQAGAR
jgi:N-acetyl-anhydromuramyl-L-alanine amidase AmpD